MDIWLSVLLSIPIAFIVNLATPYVQRLLSRISSGYEQRIAERDEYIRKRAAEFVNDHTKYLLWTVREESAKTSNTVLIIGAMVMSMMAVLTSQDFLIGSSYFRWLALAVATVFAVMTTVMTVMVQNRTRHYRRVHEATKKVISEESPDCVPDCALKPNQVNGHTMSMNTEP
jgi:hypothetical protein